MPNEMGIKQANPQQAEIQVPIFPIPVRSNDSYLIYALCFHAVETGIYADMPEILPQLQAMKSGLEMSYQRLGIPMFEYRRFVIHPKASIPPFSKGARGIGVGEPCEPKAFGVGEPSEHDEEASLVETTKKGEEENVEMGTE